MRYSDKDCIVIGFDGDRAHMTPIIRMTGECGLKKILQKISGKNEMEIYETKPDGQTVIKFPNSLLAWSPSM